MSEYTVSPFKPPADRAHTELTLFSRSAEDPNKITIGCDNPLPTSNYIARFPQAYGNANIVCPHDPSVQEGLLREFGLDV